MQGQRTNLHNLISTLIKETEEKLLEICEHADLTKPSDNIGVSFTGLVKEQVSELGRCVVTGYLESLDEPTAFLEREGKRYLHKGKSRKELVTALGKVNISRSYYQHWSGGKCLFPLDERLGVNRELLMPDVREVVLYACSHNTPEESSQLLDKCSLIRLHPTQIKQTITKANELLESQGEDIMENVRKRGTITKSDLLVCSLDGVNVLLNECGKRKGRPMERPTGKENRQASAYKNVMCGSITHYDVVEQEGQKQPRRLSSSYIARMPEDYYPCFKREFEKEVEGVTSAHSTVKLIITDAHRSISGYLRDNPVFEGFHRIIDYYHASEHLSLLAEALHGKSSRKATLWYAKYRNVLQHENRGVEKLIRSAYYYLAKQKYSQNREKEILKQLGYFKNHGMYMKYAEYLNKGWPIGSGVIEAACKSIVKQRMCRSGQRWSIKGGQAILNLRTIVKSNRWPTFWNEFSERYHDKISA